MKKHLLTPILALFVLPLLLVLALLGALVPGAQAQDADTAALGRVAEAILAWDGQNPGDLFKAVKQANPDKSAIVSMRELNKAFADKRMPAPIADNSAAIIQKQKAAQQSVRGILLSAREATYSRYRSSNPEAFRSIYGYGDIGSWPNAAVPDASMDIDCTVLGTDRNVTAALRNDCQKDLLRQLTGDDSKLTLADFDIVITAEGHEVAAGVFETEGGIDWAKRNMKRVTIVQPDGRSRTYQLNTEVVITRDRKVAQGSDPVAEMAQAEHMARFRDLASKGGDYDKLFDERGFLKSQIFDDPNNTAAQALWNKYMDSLSDFGIDYYRSRSSTATGGCLDMAKHLQEEVITKKHVPQAKLKKTLKYVSRADNISRGVPGLEKILASDPLLNDPAYRDVVDLARKVLGASDAAIDSIIQERFGDVPDAGLQELGNKARRAILRMSEVAFQAEMDRIILEIPDMGARKAALDTLTNDFRIVAEEGGEYGELSRGAVEQIAKVQDANDAGTIDQIRKNYQSLEKIRQADQGLVSSTVEFLKQTELGGKMFEMGGKVLEIGKKPVISVAEPRYRSASLDFCVEIADATRAKGLTAVQILGSAAMWAEVLDSVRTAKSNAELAIALGKTLINNTFFGMVLNSAYAGIVQGDNNALAKAVMYMLVPEAALPALVEALGNTAINMGAQMLIDAQMENVYQASTIKDGQITDFGSLRMAGAGGAKYFVDTMCDGVPEEVAQAMIGRPKKSSDFAKGLDANAIKAVAKSIRSTVDNGTLLIYKEDGGLAKAAAAIRRITEDITDCAKAWGVEIALSAVSAGDLPDGLDKGQTKALVTLMEGRARARGEARTALVDAIVRTFLERNRAEASLDSGKATDDYNALLKIFEDLGISKEGYASLNAEGAPYTVYTNWKTAEREKQVTAVKAVQKFKDAYTTVLQARLRAEEAARSNLGDGYAFAPRPLTGSLPLTAKPELDLQIAGAYLSEVGKIGQSTVSELALIKQAKLEGAYDTDMFKQLYDVRLRMAYQSAMMKAASDAQQLHWAVEVFDKQALYDKHSEAAAKASELQKADTGLQDEFRNHYAVQGEFIVELTGPEQITSGEEARLVATVKIRPKQGTPGPVPPDIAQQFRYAWRSGKSSLGEGPEPSRSYRLDTVGTHEFIVAVKQTLIQAGKTVEKAIGEKPWTVRVVAPPVEKPKPDTKEKPTTPDPKKPGEKPPAEKPPAEIIPATISQPGETGFADAGALQAGAWLLQGQSDQIQKKSDDVDGRGAKLNVYTLTVSGQTIESGTQWYGSARPRSMRSTLSLPNFPARVVMDQPTDLRIQLSRKTDGIFDDAIVTIFRQEGSPNLMMRLSGADIQTNNYNGLAFDLFSSFMYRVPTAGEIQSVKVKFVGPGGQFMRTYSYAWQPGGAKASAAPPSAAITPLAVNIASDKPTVVPGETAVLKATVTGGAPPFTFAWTGPAKGASDQLAFTADKPGTQAFTVTVSDSKGATATASASVTTEAPTVTIQRTTQGTVVLGQSFGFQAQMFAAGKPMTGAFVFRWEPHPAVTYAPHEGAATQTTAVFTRPGRTLVWVDVLRKEGSVLVTVAESEQIEIDVVSPELSLAANPATPFTGQEVRINVTMNPAIQDKYVTFWWDIQGNALNAGPVVVGDAYSRAYTYKPKDTAPVTVTVHGKSKDGGDDLGQKSLAVTAKFYDVKIDEPRLMGPPPRVWSEQAKSLVEVPRAIGTFQDFFVKASVSPPPPDSSLRYEWTSQPEGCVLGSRFSQETKGNASRGGTFNLAVTVRDSQNIVLGSGERTVSIVEPTPEPKKTEPVKPPSKAAEAMAKLKEASALAADGKMDEAIAAADEASALDPTSRPISSYTQQLKATKAQLLQHLDNVRSLGQKGVFEDASAELAKAKELVPNSPLVAAAEAQLKALKQKSQQEAAKTAESKKAETANLQSTNQAAANEKLKQAYVLNQQGKFDEGLALSEEALRLDPTNENAGIYVRSFRASLHINQAISLGEAGRIDEAAAEVAEAKKDFPSHTKLPEYERWISQLRQQQAAAAAKKAEAANQQSANQAAAQEKLKQANALAQQNKVDEALALSEEALRLDPANANTGRYVRFFRAAQHLNQALSLGKAGRLDEATAEVAEAKKDDPSYPKIPEYEKWLQQLIQQRDAAKVAAELKKAETANQAAANAAERKAADQKAAEDRAAEARAREVAARAAERKAADQKAAEDRAAEARAREAAAKAAAEEKKRQGPPELAGTSWNGEATLSNEHASFKMPITMSIDGDNQISGEVALTVPDEEERLKLPLKGTYNPQTGAFDMKFSLADGEGSIGGTLVGTVKSSSSAEGPATLVAVGLGLDTTVKGTWRISRR